MRIKLTLTIGEKVLSNYKKLCQKEGINISRRVNLYQSNLPTQTVVVTP